jgi:tight adherence protein B
MNIVLLSTVVFLIVTVGVGLVAYVFRDKGDTSEDRLAAFTGKKDTGSQSEVLEIWRKEAMETDTAGFLSKILSNLPNIAKFFEQAECNIAPSTLLAVSLVLGAIGMTLSILLRVPLVFAPLPGFLLFLIPWMWLWMKRSKRLKKFAEQLPDALELVARALRAGHSLASGLHVVAEEMPAPIAPEFGRAYEEQNLGVTLEDSLRALADRVPNLDLRFFVTSVSIQRATGGDLAEILDKIGHLIRERYRIMGQVMALTGEGRLSGVVLIVLPFVLFITVLHLNPDYVSLLWTTDMGIKMSIYALISQFVGALVIRWIVNIKV